MGVDGGRWRAAPPLKKVRRLFAIFTQCVELVAILCKHAEPYRVVQQDGARPGLEPTTFPSNRHRTTQRV